jgi:hypothetical protein
LGGIVNKTNGITLLIKCNEAGANGDNIFNIWKVIPCLLGALKGRMVLADPAATEVLTP